MTPPTLFIAPLAFSHFGNFSPLNHCYRSQNHYGNRSSRRAPRHDIAGVAAPYINLWGRSSQHLLAQQRPATQRLTIGKDFALYESSSETSNENNGDFSGENGNDNDDPENIIQSSTPYADDDKTENTKDFFDLMSPIETVKPEQMSASTLAYLGDVLFELFIRSRYVWPQRRTSDLQNKVVSIVRAEFQSTLLRKFVEVFPLTPEERSVVARGRNAKLTAKKMQGRNTKDSGGGASAYQDSTALEALLGYAYISDKNRFNAMIQWMKAELDTLDEGGNANLTAKKK